MALPCCTTEGKLLSCWKLKCLCARSEVVITPPCHGGDRRFKSGRARHETTSSFDGVFSCDKAAIYHVGSIIIAF